MDKRMVQVNIRTSAETAERLKAMADQGGITLGVLIEKLLDCYYPDSRVIASGDDWQDALATLRDELANEFQTAVKALESRLVALEAASMGKVAPKQKAAVIGLKSAIEPSSSALPKESMDTGQNGKEPAKYAIRDATIIELHAAGLTISKISAALAEQGIVSREGNPVNPGTICTVMKRLGLSRSAV